MRASEITMTKTVAFTMVKVSSMKCMLLAVITAFLVLNTRWFGRQQVLAIDSDTSVNVNQLRWRDVRSKLTGMVDEYCGDDRLCKGGHVERKCTTCDSCSCDSACLKSGDCCIDKLIDDVLLNTSLGNTSPFEVSMYTECVDTRVRAINLQVPPRKHIMFTSCPEGQDAHKLRAECDYSGDINQHMHATVYRFPVSQVPFWSNWPVYSTTTKTFYKNQACAQCHNDAAHLIRWDLEIRCEDSKSEKEFSSVDYVLTQPYCDVIFIPPAAAKNLPRYCRLDGVDQSFCNATDEQVTNDPILMKACEVFSWPPAKSGSLRYRNVFCGLCDGKTIYQDRSFCLDERGSTFLITVSPRAIKRMEDKYRLRCKCEDNEVWDPYTSRCRKLHCGPGTLLSYDSKNGTAKCLPDNISSRYSRGFAYDLHLNMIVKSKRTMPIVNETSFERNSQDGLRTQSFIVYYKQENRSPTSSNYGDDLSSNPSNSKSSSLSFGLSTRFVIKSKMSPSIVAEKLLALDNHTWPISFLSSDGIELPLTLTTTLAPGKPSALENVLFGSQKTGEFTVKQFTLDEDKTMLLTAHYLEMKDWHQLAEYLEVRNTLLCPFLVADDSLGVKLKSDSDRQNLFSTNQQALLHSDSGLELSFKDFYKYPEGKIILCAPALIRRMKEKEALNEGGLLDDTGLIATSYVCLSVSCLCLLATLVTYCLFPSLRTLPGKNIMALVVSLLGTTVSLLMSSLLDTGSVVCQATGVVVHFFLLCSIAWMVIGSWHVHRVFSHVMGNARTQEENARLFVKFCLMAFSYPVVIVTVTIVTNIVLSYYSDDDEVPVARSVDELPTAVIQESFPCSKNGSLDIGYGQGVCYISDPMSVLLAAAIPLALAVAFNFVLYVKTIWALKGKTSEQKLLGKDQTSQISTYAKLATITGLNWIPGLVSGVVESKFLVYLFVLLAGLQGVYIFFAFVANRRVRGLYRSLLERDSSQNKSRKNAVSCGNKARRANTTPNRARKSKVTVENNGGPASSSADSPDTIQALEIQEINSRNNKN